MKEQVDDIADVITEVSEMMGVPMTDLERRTMSRRLARYHGIDLFRILRALPEGKFFPSGAELEQRVRRAMGMDPAKGISEELVERNRKELIAQGQDPKKAEGGARIARNSLRLPVIVDSSVPPGEARLRNDKGEIVGKIVNMADQFEDPLAMLEAEDISFDPLAELNSF